VCQATVYLKDRKVMEDVISVEVVGDDVRLTTFLDEPRLVRARIRYIDLLKHRVLLEAPTEVEDE